jgi:hypothetical protein
MTVDLPSRPGRESCRVPLAYRWRVSEHSLLVRVAGEKHPQEALFSSNQHPAAGFVFDCSSTARAARWDDSSCHGGCQRRSKRRSKLEH